MTMLDDILAFHREATDYPVVLCARDTEAQVRNALNQLDHEYKIEVLTSPYLPSDKIYVTRRSVIEPGTLTST